MHIGLIGGIGPAAAVFYYHHLSIAHLKAQRPLELTMVNADAAGMIGNLRTGAREAQAVIFARLARRLQATGADIVVVPSIAGHFCIQELEAISPLPVLSIIPAVRERLERLGLQRVGLIGTAVAMGSRLYGGLNGFDVRVPAGADFDATDREYLGMATTGAATDRHREFFFRVCQDLQRDGAEAVLLAGTDLCLVFDGYDCGVPTVDCALAHVEAITRRSLA
jgi:aspartate racemase